MHPLNLILRSGLFAVLAMLGLAQADAAEVTYPLDLSAGWNLVGNSLASPMNVKTTFGTQTAIATVWTWNATSGNWSFYAPALDNNGTLASYAATKGYAVLTTINPGEGFWVNASTAFGVGSQSGTGFSLTASQLHAGWNLVATSDLIAPAAFTTTIGNVTTLWAWDTSVGGWYFYAPTMAANNTLTSYLQSRGYKDFGGLKLGNGMGFWVNYAGAPSAGDGCLVMTPTLGSVASSTFQMQMPDGSTSIFTQKRTFTTVSGSTWTTTDSWGMTAVNIYSCNQIALVSNNTGFSTDTYNPPLQGLPSNLDVGFTETLSTTHTNVAFGNTCTGTKTYTLEVLAAESVTVPAGTFNALKIHKTNNAYLLNCTDQTAKSFPATTTTEWEVANTGLVKSEQPESVLELLSSTAPAVASLTITPTSLSTLVGSMESLAATASYLNIQTSEDVTYTASWSSSNPQVATVDQYGLVKAVAIGTAQITASMGGVSASTTVTVTEEPVIQGPIPISSSATDTAQSIQADAQELFNLNKNYYGLEKVFSDLGFGIRYPDNSVSGDATQLILFDKWNVDEIESAIHQSVTVTLDDYVIALQMAIEGAVTGQLPAEAPAVDVQLRTQLLDALRATAQGKDSASSNIRDMVHLIVALGRERAVGPYDLLDPAVPGDVELDAVQTGLLTQRLAAELWRTAQQFKPLGKAMSLTPNKGLLATAAAPAPCSMNKTEGYVMDGFASAMGMVYGGISAGDQSVMKGIYEKIGESAEKSAAFSQVANILLNYTKLLWSAIAFKADMSVNPSPLIRTKTKFPGAGATVGATFTLDIGNAQILNCIRPALNLAGIDFSAPADGPLAGSRVQWFVDEKVYVKTGYNPVYNSDWGVIEVMGTDQLDHTTDANGHDEISIQGKPQKNDLTAKNADGSKKKLVCVDRKVKVIAKTNLKNKDIKQDFLDLTGAAGGVTALATLPVGILERMPSKLFEGQILVPVKDFEVIEGDVFLVNAEYLNPSEGTISNVSDQVTATLQTKCNSFGQCTGAVMQVKDTPTSFTKNLCEDEEILGTEEKFTYDGGSAVSAYYNYNSSPSSGAVNVTLSGTTKMHGLSEHTVTCACDDDPIAPSTGKTTLNFSFDPFEFVAGASSITVDQRNGNGAGWKFTVYKPDDLVDGDICL